jgi:uncharacterized protein (DUF58 family)
VNGAAPLLPSAAELERAARILAVRSRREVSSAFAGGYRSAFRGGGVEFEESRPYAPGDDVRHLDWNALARTGSPYVKRFREERDQTVLLALDVSRSMAFGSAGRSKAALGAHAAALLAGAAFRAGDRVGLATFTDVLQLEIEAERGHARLFPLLRRLAEASAAPRGESDLPGALSDLGSRLRRRAVVIVLSDFRDDAAFPPAAPGAKDGPATGLAHSALVGLAHSALVGLTRSALGGLAHSWLVRLCRHHDVVAGLIEDPREVELPAAGAFRIGDAERGGRALLLRSDARTRERYRLAAAARRRALERTLRSSGADVLWLRTDRDPLRALARFVEARPGHVARVAA